jgi:hypothetical protein
MTRASGIAARRVIVLSAACRQPNLRLRKASQPPRRGLDSAVECIGRGGRRTGGIVSAGKLAFGAIGLRSGNAVRRTHRSIRFLVRPISWMMSVTLLPPSYKLHRPNIACRAGRWVAAVLSDLPDRGGSPGTPAVRQAAGQTGDLPSAIDDHRNRAVGQHLHRLAAENHGRDPASAMRSHDD